MTDGQKFNRLPVEVEQSYDALPRSKLTMGIDLGTTNSCVAVVEDDFPKVIPTRKGQRTTPSIVALDEKGRLLVGEDARKQLLINPINTIYGAKRFIGRTFYSKEAEALSRHFSYAILPLGDMAIGAKIGGHVFSLPQVSAMILNEMRRSVCEYFKQNVVQAVISVPAYYTENQRAAVREAGRIARLDVVRIINEPTAAALAYGLNKDYDKRVLVYDLGGGTFDASLLQVFENSFRVLSTGGDTFLGGVDFDERVVDHLLAEYERIEKEILQCDSVITQRIKDAAERSKIELSSKNTALIDLPYITIAQSHFKDFKLEIDRARLNDLTEDLVARTLSVCEEVLLAAGVKPDAVDAVLLVGGQTRMPLVVERVTRFFGKPPTKGVHPDEVVACGAALMGYSLGRDTSVRLIDVLPLSIGGRQPSGDFKVFFPANNTLPAEREIGVATTRDNQTEIEIFLYQGESQRAAENEYLGSFVISGFPRLPKGQIKLAVKLSLNQESILELTARSLSGDHVIEVRVNTKEPTAPEVERKPEGPPAPAVENRRFSGLRGFIRRISF